MQIENVVFIAVCLSWMEYISTDYRREQERFNSTHNVYTVHENYICINVQLKRF